MSYHQCSIMLVQLPEYIIADIQVYYNTILMYVCNIYLGISSPPQFPDVDKEIYMEQPEGFAAPRSERKVLRLWRALYGLKQAGLAWWRTLDESLQELGF